MACIRYTQILKNVISKAELLVVVVTQIANKSAALLKQGAQAGRLSGIRSRPIR
jgi:hypothetical protein